MRLLLKQHSVNDVYLGPDFETHGRNLKRKPQCLKVQSLKLHEDCHERKSVKIVSVKVFFCSLWWLLL